MLNMRIFRESREKKILTRNGFTLIEVLVVVAVSAVIATGGFVMFSGYQKNQNIKLTLSELAATIRDIQKRSVTQENGKQWGIRLSNGVSDSFQTWSGLSYASGTPDQTYSLKRNIQFGNPPSGFTTDLIFQAMTGILGGDRIVTVNSGAGALVGDVIINTRGKVTTRVEKGLVGYWHFDEGTSTVAYDASGNANNGTLTNGPTWQSGVNCKAGECLNFNGTNNYVQVLNMNSLPLDSHARSMTGWIKTNGTQSGRIVYFGYGGATTDLAFNLASGVSNDGKIYFIGYADDLAGSTVIGDGNWHFIAVTYDGTTVTLYVDGKFDSSAAKPNLNTSNVNTYPLVIGRQSYPDTLNYWYQNGWIDEVRVYNRALSAQEVLDIYNDLK